jgi:DNA-binding GntR family transcriptional regulator
MRIVQQSNGRAVAPGVKGGPANSEQAIADRIFSAVMAQRLPPGTKLAENILCESFGASRARIRRVLLTLAERKVVELRSNRGAFVACPTADEAKDVFAARRAIEPPIVRAVAAKIKRPQVAELRRHVEREGAAHVAGNRHEAIRLSGDFHIRLAGIAGNSVLTRFVEDLVARTSLIIALFGSTGISSCLDDEHRALLAAVARGDGDGAADDMTQHLAHIESDLDLSEIVETEVDVRAILGERSDGIA